jgi:hypothetical protein
MDETQWGLVDILGPAILGILLLWLVFRTRRHLNNPREVERTEEATHNLYKEEEQRRRDGTDGM